MTFRPSRVIRFVKADRRACLLPFLLLAVALPLAVLKYSRLVSAEFDTSHPESALPAIGLWANSSGHLYPSLSASPYTPAPHGPAYYETLSFLARFSNARFRNLILLARVLSLCSFLICSLLAAGIAWKVTRSSLVSAATALLVAMNPIFYPFPATARPDLLALGFSLGAVFCFCLSEKPLIGTVVTAGVLSGVAVVFKQSFVSAAAAIGLVLLIALDWKKLALFLLGVVAVPATLLCSLAIQGEPVLRELLVMGSFRMDSRSAVPIVWTSLFFPEQLVLMSLGLCGIWLLSKRSDFRSRVLLFYFCVSLGITLLTIRNVGASRNYFMEPLTVLAIAASVTLVAIGANWLSLPGDLKPVFLLMLALGLGYLPVALHIQKLELPDSRLMALLPGKHVLSDQPYFSARGLNPELLDPFTTTQLELRGKWSSAPLQDEIRRHAFDLVIVGIDEKALLQDGMVAPRKYRGYRFLGDGVFRSLQQNYRAVCLIPVGRGAVFMMLVPADDYQEFAEYAKVSNWRLVSPTVQFQLQ